MRPSGGVVRRVLTASLALGLGWITALAFVGDLNIAQQWRRWSLNPTDTRVPQTSVNRATRAIVYRLDRAGAHGTNTARELDAVRTAFDLWQQAPGTVLKFEEGATAQGTVDVNSADGFNTFFWATNLFVNGGRDNLAGVLALTYVGSFSDGNVIFDSDTVFNAAQFRWSTDGLSTQTQDPFVEAIALHEIGHLLGLRHSPVGGATMLFVGDQGVNSQVGLSEDERAAVRALYGTAATASLMGRVSGTVRVSGTPVLGAAVFVEDAAGRVVAGTVTRSNGVYELPGLAEGLYAIRAAPLDASFGANYLIRGADIAPAYRNAATEFKAGDARSVSVVTRGSAVVDFDLLPGAPLRIARLLRPAGDLSAPSYNNKPVALPPDGLLRYVGVLTPATPVESAPFRLTLGGAGVSHGDVVVRANALGSMTLVAVPVRLETNAAAGLRTLRLERGAESAWAHGFVEVLPAVPDINGDGLDDRFQRRHWSRFTHGDAAPEADPDLDRFNNQWEFERGSDPTDRSSVNFEVLSVQVTSAGAKVRAETAPGARFRLLRRSAVEGGAWVVVGADRTATSSVTEFEDASATHQVEFYRVALVQD